MPVGAIEDERNLPPEEEEEVKEELTNGDIEKEDDKMQVDEVEEYDVEDHVDGSPDLRFG